MRTADGERTYDRHRGIAIIKNFVTDVADNERNDAKRKFKGLEEHKKLQCLHSAARRSRMSFGTFFVESPKSLFKPSWSQHYLEQTTRKERNQERSVLHHEANSGNAHSFASVG